MQLYGNKLRRINSPFKETSRRWSNDDVIFDCFRWRHRHCWFLVSFSAWQLKPTTSENEEEKTASLRDNWNFWKQRGKNYNRILCVTMILKPATSENEEEKTASNLSWQLGLPTTSENVEEKTVSYFLWKWKSRVRENENCMRRPFLKRRCRPMTIETYNFWKRRRKTASLRDNWNFWKQRRKNYNLLCVTMILKPATSENEEEKTASLMTIRRIPTTSENVEEKTVSYSMWKWKSRVRDNENCERRPFLKRRCRPMTIETYNFWKRRRENMQLLNEKMEICSSWERKLRASTFSQAETQTWP